MKYIMGKETRDLPACSTVPQPTPLPRVVKSYKSKWHWTGCPTSFRRMRGWGGVPSHELGHIVVYTPGAMTSFPPPPPAYDSSNQHQRSLVTRRCVVTKKRSSNHFNLASKFKVEWLARLRLQEIPRSNLGPESGCFLAFLQFFQPNTGIVL
jgi:hypothetical protein